MANTPDAESRRVEPLMMRMARQTASRVRTISAMTKAIGDQLAALFQPLAVTTKQSVAGAANNGCEK